MKAYKCDKNGFFLYETTLYLDPVRREPVLHLDETTVEILPEKKGFVRKFNFNPQIWEYVEDHTGEIFYNKETKEKVEIKEYGKVAYNLTDKEPLPYSKWDSAKNNWVLDENLVAQGIADKKQSLIGFVDNKVSTLINKSKEYTAFDQQRMEAQIWTLDNSNPVPLLSALSETIGMPLPELVKRCLEKTEKQSKEKGKIIGQEVKFKKQIKTATTLEQLDKIEQEINNWV